MGSGSAEALLASADRITANAGSFVPADLDICLRQLAEAARVNDNAGVIAGLKALIPE